MPALSVSVIRGMSVGRVGSGLQLCSTRLLGMHLDIHPIHVEVQRSWPHPIKEVGLHPYVAGTETTMMLSGLHPNVKLEQHHPQWSDDVELIRSLWRSSTLCGMSCSEGPSTTLSGVTSPNPVHFGQR